MLNSRGVKSDCQAARSKPITSLILPNRSLPQGGTCRVRILRFGQFVDGSLFFPGPLPPSRFTWRLNAEVLANSFGGGSLDLTMSGYLRLRAVQSVLHDRMTTSLTNNHTAKPGQVFKAKPTFHVAPAIRAAISKWIASISTAFLSRAFRLGGGRDSPCSSLCSAIKQRASLIIFRACSMLLPCEITPGKSRTRTMNQPSSIG